MTGSKYALAVSTRNVGGDAYTAKSFDLGVVSENTVARTVAVPLSNINAGGYVTVVTHTYDQYGNEIVEWAHGWKSSITSSPAPTGTLSPSDIPTPTTAPSSPETFTVKTSSTAGINALKFVVDESTQTANIATAAIDTRNVGDPTQVVLMTRAGKTNYASDESAKIFVRLEDAKGNSSSNLVARTYSVKLVDANNNVTQLPLTVPAGYSDSEDSLISAVPGQILSITAVDPIGLLAASPALTLTWGTVATTGHGVAYRIAVTAAKMVPAAGSTDGLYNATGLDQKAFGYAAANGTNQVSGTDQIVYTAQVVDAYGAAVASQGVVATMTIINSDADVRPVGRLVGGTGDEVVKTTDANGQFTFAMTSTARSYSGTYTLPGATSASSLFTPVSVDSLFTGVNGVHDYAFGMFSLGALQPLASSKPVLLVDGKDTVSFTAVVKDTTWGTPMPGVDVAFSTTAGSPSTSTVKTDANGEAVFVLSASAMNAAGVATVTAQDQYGNSRTASVDLTDIKLTAVPVTNDVQGGSGATARVKVSFAKLDGTPVVWTPTSGSIINVPADALFVGETTTTVNGAVVANGLLYDVSVGDALPATGARTFTFSGGALELVAGPFTQHTVAAGSASVTVNFANNATVSAKYGIPSLVSLPGQVSVSGAGFNPADVGSTRDASVAVAIGGTTYNLGHFQINSSGMIPLDVFTTDANVNLPQLTPGQSYDLYVDGILFSKALTVQTGGLRPLNLMLGGNTAQQSGVPFTVTGAIYDPLVGDSQGSVPLPQHVYLESSIDGGLTWHPLAETWTSSLDGKYSFNVTLSANAMLHTVFKGDDTYAFAESNRLPISVSAIPAPTTFAIAKSVTGSGSIGGPVSVTSGDDAAFTFTPAEGYRLSDVTINGTSVGIVSNYTVHNVTANLAVGATFVAIPAPATYAIAKSVTGSGSIGGPVSVTSGDDAAFTFTPAEGYRLSDVTINGTSVGIVSNYTVHNVTANLAVGATFVAIPVPVVHYAVTTIVNGNGTITGDVSPIAGSNSSYVVTPAAGYHVVSVLLDGALVGTSFTINGVSGDHMIIATFAANGPTATTISMKTASTTILRYKYLGLSTVLSGGVPAGTTVRFEVKKPGSSKYVSLATRSVNTAGASSYRYKVPARGTYYFRVRFLGTTAFKASTSVSRKVVCK